MYKVAKVKPKIEHKLELEVYDWYATDNVKILPVHHLAPF